MLLLHLSIQSILMNQLLNRSKEFEDQSWNPYNDICAIKKFDRTGNPVRKVNCAITYSYLATYIRLLP